MSIIWTIKLIIMNSLMEASLIKAVVMSVLTLVSMFGITFFLVLMVLCGIIDNE